MPAPVTLIGLFLERDDGSSPEKVDDYEPAQFDHQVPAVGDLIVDPGVQEGQNRGHPENRTIYEVIARYFEPRDVGVRIHLVVRARQGRRDEISILG